jgi:flagellar basal body-associated protein FliL
MRMVGSVLAVWLSLVCATSFAASKKEPVDDGRDFRYLPMTPTLVVNVGSSGRIAFLKADVTLRVATSAADNVQLHMPALRHELIMFLSRQSDEQLGNAEALRLTALEAARKVISDAEAAAMPVAPQGAPKPPAKPAAKPAQEAAVQDLLFTTFVMQR